jgi:dihydropteroate synthase
VYRSNDRLHLENRVAVMAIINRTPDSFYDDGATFALDKAVAAALAAAEDGADLVDIGGVPFGRGPAVSLQEEIDRVVPVVEAIHAASGIAQPRAAPVRTPAPRLRRRRARGRRLSARPRGPRDQGGRSARAAGGRPRHDLNKNTLHSLEITRRLEGSLAAAVVCVTKGAHMVRVHDVRASVAAMRMTEALLGLRAPAYLRHNMGG